MTRDELATYLVDNGIQPALAALAAAHAGPAMMARIERIERMDIDELLALLGSDAPRRWGLQDAEADMRRK